MPNSILNFLREGFEQLEHLNLDEIDNLFTATNLYQTNPNKLANKNELNRLIAESGHLYYLLGKQMSKAQAIRDRTEKEIDYKLENATNTSGKKSLTSSTKKDIERFLLQDVGYLRLQNQLVEVEALITYLKMTQTSLYMQHYALRTQSTDQQQLNYNQQIHNSY